MDVDSPRALAFRLAGHGLAEPGADALALWAVQDSPPGAAAAAILARAGSPDVLEDGAVCLYNARTATAVVRAGDAPAFGTALLPEDDAGLKAIVGSAVPERREGFAEPVALAVEAISAALDGRVLTRDELHAELRRRLPEELLPWCPGCQSHHARRGLLVLASLHGRLCLAGRAGRQPRFARTDQRTGWDAPPRAQAGAELVRRYLSAYGPSSPAELAQWAGIAGTHARALWARVTGELAEVRLAGTRAWVLERDLPRLAAPPPAAGVRLLAPGDPLLLGRDRERLIPDAAVRRQLWSPIATTGLVLGDGAPVALWKARKQGRRLAVTLRPFAPVDRPGVLAAAERLAPHRGCDQASLDE